ncbi:MAG: sugar phosphate isomerase/epimerase [Deltaproteobacteria bacterium]|nr:sugar phosphate isomerase/epimerase [Deltaproteobacteria bacterium]MBW1960431.1 sugar phosphate isomerase/epimerase [Deltaproteobacteria bacterium]MBW1993016.1 sugar phosphate isomerase/epimerase [Deltaproteobacteria bacterium]MBW2151417.1 sugar phosphate isomerase/epimerase [Deltaproteobacteria bacterium]
MMKLCFNAGPEPVENYFSFAHENNFPWMELSCNNPSNFLDKFNDKRISNIKRLRDRHGIRYGLHSASFVNSAEIEPTVRKAVQQHLMDYMELAHRLEAEYIVLHFGYHFSLFMDEVFRCLIENYKPVVELAEKYDLPIGIENMNKVHEECEIVYLGVTIEEFKRVFEALPSKHFGLTLDVAHASLLPGGPKSFMDAFPDKIISTHISDNDLYLDRHLPVGEGKVDFRAVFQQLISLGFTGTLNIELKKNDERLLSKQRLEPILKDLGAID